ncbi:MAG: ATP-binding protein [Nitrospirota bacterium]
MTMLPYHSLLKRQLKRFFGSLDSVPPEWRPFVEAVDKAYREADADRSMLERSLDLSSQELLQSNSELRAIVQAFPDIFFRLDAAGTILEYKAGSVADFYLPPERLLGKRIQDVPLGDIGSRFEDALARLRKRGGSILSLEYALVVYGRNEFYEARLVPLRGEQILVIVRNITERRRAEELRLRQNRVLELLAAGHPLHVVLEALVRSVEEQFPSMLCSILLLDKSGRHLRHGAAPSLPGDYCRAIDGIAIGPTVGSCGTAAFLGETVIVEDIATDPLWAKHRELPLRHGLRACWSKPILATNGQVLGTFAMYYREPRKPASDDLQLVEAAVHIAKVAIERRQAEESLRLSEESLRQAQKMEAVGKLAGGIAHDFNNLLTVIIGYSETLLRKLIPKDPLRRSAEQIRQAAERATSLTNQLLAFSRKQVLQPKVLDLNLLVTNMETMLRRLIGEHIKMVSSLCPELWLVQADPGQLEQVILNLALNARDAMEQGGQLTIHTDNVELDARYDHPHGSMPPGPYVKLAVSDTGCGMSPETQARLFEPFFTTKGPGKGTGMGLATVYGIVRQSNGGIVVTSAPGQGSTFTIYLPRAEGTPATFSSGPEIEEAPSGLETVLLVEDEDGVRTLAREVLEESGYTVLEAANGFEAMAISERCAGPIHLLITDVVMPGMSGRELAQRFEVVRPEAKVLFISGYTDDAIGHHGILDQATAFLQKPFTPAAILKKVRETLVGRSTQ